VIIALAWGAATSAAPEPYRQVSWQSTTSVVVAVQSESELSLDSVLTLDLAASSVDFQSLALHVQTRRFDLADASLDGFKLTAFANMLSPPCEVPPCESPITLNDSLLVLNPGPFGAIKGLLSPGNEFMASIYSDGGRVGASTSALIGAQFLVAKPKTLVVGDLFGSYTLLAYSSILSNLFDETQELVVVNELSVDFGGDGSCIGSSTALTEAWLVSEWPDLSSRETPFAKRETPVAASACSYSVDQGEGSVTVSLMFDDDEGGLETVTMPLFVSSQYRYLIGTVALTEIDTGETEHELDLLVGLRTAGTVVNAELAGLYFVSILGERFSSDGHTGGAESDSVARYALSLMGDTPNAEGYSGCAIIASTGAAVRRSLGGTVPNVHNTIVEYAEVATPLYDVCRYRTNGDDRVDVDFGNGFGDWLGVRMVLSEDRSTLIGGVVVTTNDPLTLEVETAIVDPGGGLISAWLVTMQRFNGTSMSAAVAEFASPLILPEDTNVVLVASVLPGSRSVEVGTTATAFATVINAGTEDALRCDIFPATSLNAGFFYQTTDPLTNAAIGFVNMAVDIPAGASQSFFFGVTPIGQIPQTEVELEFACANAAGALSVVGVNTLLLSADVTPGPDIVVLAATLSNDGIAHLDAGDRTGFVSIASVNLGATAAMTVSVDTGGVSLPLSTTICQTDPITGACINPSVPLDDAVALTITTNDTPTFGVFISANAAISLDAATKRIFLRFRDAAGVVRGSTSVAVQTD
jgi:hypothetical protein